MISQIEVRNRILSGDEDLPPVLATLPDASREADDASERLFHHHRGAYRCHGRRIVAFGNDGFREDRRSRRELAHVVEVSLSHGLSLDAFGVSCEDGYTWALVVSCPERSRTDGAVNTLRQAAIDAWLEASGVTPPSDPSWVGESPSRRPVARH